VAEDIEASTAGLREIPDRLYEGYIFDLDGTIYLGDELLPGLSPNVTCHRCAMSNKLTNRYRPSRSGGDPPLSFPHRRSPESFTWAVY
jgi:hypothetical protein